MTATATAQVLGIWQQYFAAAPRPEEEEAAAAADAGAGCAKEVQEVCRCSARLVDDVLSVYVMSICLNNTGCVHFIRIT